jgi:hypothetical protein
VCGVEFCTADVLPRLARFGRAALARRKEVTAPFRSFLCDDQHAPFIKYIQALFIISPLSLSFTTHQIKSPDHFHPHRARLYKAKQHGD